MLFESGPGCRGDRRPRAAGSRGFTLVEALFASVVLALAVGGVSQAMVAGQAATYNALHESRALALAQALMEEIVSRPTLDPEGDTLLGPDGGEASRAQFDAVDDFAGYGEAAGALADFEGRVYPAAYQGFERSVRVSPGSAAAGVLGGARDSWEVVVEVSEPGGRSWRVSRSLVGELR